MRARLTADHTRERLDTPLVERRPGLGAQVVDRVLLRPRVAVDPLRDQRVVDVADREDPSVERELTGDEAARVAVAVEPLVMVAYEPRTPSLKPPSSVEGGSRGPRAP